MVTIYVEYLKLLSTVLVAVIGWIVAHYFTTLRDKKIKRREISIEYLTNAYRVLASDIANREFTDERKDKLMSILIDIQLFGSVEQIELAKELIEEIVSKPSRSYDPLINNLRNELRKYLKLKSVDGNLKWLRFESVD